MRALARLVLAVVCARVSSDGAAAEVQNACPPPTVAELLRLGSGAGLSARLACLSAEARSALPDDVNATLEGVRHALGVEVPGSASQVPSLRASWGEVLRTSPIVRGQLRQLSSRLTLRLSMEEAIEHRERVAWAVAKSDPMPTAVPRVYETMRPSITLEVLPEDEVEMAHVLFAAAEAKQVAAAASAKARSKPSGKAPPVTATARPPAARVGTSVKMEVLPSGPVGGVAGISGAVEGAGEDPGGRGAEPTARRRLSPSALLQARSALALLRAQALPLLRVEGIAVVYDFRCAVARSSNVTLVEWLGMEPGRAPEMRERGEAYPQQGGGGEGDAEGHLRAILQAGLHGPSSGIYGGGAGPSSNGDKGGAKLPPKGAKGVFASGSGGAVVQRHAFGALWSADALFAPRSPSGAEGAPRPRRTVTFARLVSSTTPTPRPGAATASASPASAPRWVGWVDWTEARGRAEDFEGGTGEEVAVLDNNAPPPSGASISHCTGTQRSSEARRGGREAGFGLFSPILNAHTRAEALQAASIRLLQLAGIVACTPLRLGWTVAHFLVWALTAPARHLGFGLGTMTCSLGSALAGRDACSRAAAAMSTSTLALLVSEYRIEAVRTWHNARPYVYAYGVGGAVEAAVWAARVAWDTPLILFRRAAPALDLSYVRPEAAALRRVLEAVEDVETQWAALAAEARGMQEALDLAAALNASTTSGGALSLPSCSGAGADGGPILRGVLARAYWTADGSCAWERADEPALYSVLAAGMCLQTAGFTLCPFRHVTLEGGERADWVGWVPAPAGGPLSSPLSMLYATAPAAQGGYRLSQVARGVEARLLSAAGGSGLWPSAARAGAWAAGWLLRLLPKPPPPSLQVTVHLACCSPARVWRVEEAEAGGVRRVEAALDTPLACTRTHLRALEALQDALGKDENM
jgi:hypothetical protein